MRIIFSSFCLRAFWSFLVIGGFGLADLLIQSSPALSQGNSYYRDRDGSGGGRRAGCDHLARMAIQQNRTNANNNCEFNGPYWHNSRRKHINTCRDEGAGRGERTLYNINRFEKRENRLRRCMVRGGGARNARCDTYAKSAIARYQQSLKYRCKYSNNSWNDNYDIHYNYCRTVAASDSAKQLDVMRYQIKRCKKRRGWRGVFKF